MEAVRILQHQSDALSDHVLVSAILQLLSRAWDLEFKNIHRSSNGVADGLARLARGAPIANGVADGLARLARGAPVGAWISPEPPTEAEVWSILFGLQLPWKNGFERLIFQSDNTKALKRLNEAKAICDPGSLVRTIAKLRCWRWATMLAAEASNPSARASAEKAMAMAMAMEMAMAIFS
ncbi:hypothetical protein V6N12_019044 [Hibiscus sabdariffa]|uniref:RNase H type-1 domain-containing protein n=1 Tax=Hibiscus sabdariffa TaxID=183260 RepID=A0ABR2B9W0_9ROSI